MPPAPNRTDLTTREETMNGIWRSPKLKPKPATQSRQKTTTSTPNIISDRCPRTEERHKRLRCNDCCYAAISGPPKKMNFFSPRPSQRCRHHVGRSSQAPDPPV